MIYFTLVICVTMIYVVRHCETDGNAKKIFQGHTDLDINTLGEKQLLALKERFNNISLDAVYTSPLIRTKKTALAVKGNKDIPIITLNGLIELNGGVYEAKTFTEIGENYPDFKEIWSSRPWDFAPEKGEKMTDAYERIWKEINGIAKSNKDKTVAVVTHGGVIRCLLCKILKNDIKKLTEIPFGDNTAVSLLEFDNNMKPHIIYFNNSSHLTEELKNEDARVPSR